MVKQRRCRVDMSARCEISVEMNAIPRIRNRSQIGMFGGAMSAVVDG